MTNIESVVNTSNQELQNFTLLSIEQIDTEIIISENFHDQSGIMMFDRVWYDWVVIDHSIPSTHSDNNECVISIDDQCTSSTKRSSSDMTTVSRKSSMDSEEINTEATQYRKKRFVNYLSNIKRELIPLILTCIPFLIFNLCILVLSLEDMIVVGHLESTRSGIVSTLNTTTPSTLQLNSVQLTGFSYEMNFNTSTNSTSVYPTTSEYLASLTLATSLFNGLSIIILGLIGNGQEPLISKAFGNKHGNLIVAEWLRSLFLQTIFTIPVAIIMYFSGYVGVLFELIETTPEAILSRQIVTQLTVMFMRYLIPGLFPFIYARSLYSFMVAQRIYWPSIVVCIVCVVYNVLMSFFLVSGVGSFGGIGFYGSAITTSSTRWLMFIGKLVLMIIVIVCTKNLRAMFKNFSLREIIYATASKISEEQPQELPSTANVSPFKKEKSLKGILDHLKISFPGTIMMSSEIWGNELSTFISGFLGNTQLSVHGVILSISNFAYLIPMSLSMASTVCIAQRYGKGDYKSMRYSSHANLILSTIVMIVTIILLASTIIVLPKIYTSDTNIIYESIRILPICLIFLMVDGFQAVFGGILRGLNKPFVCAVIGVIGYFFIGFPFGCVMAFVLDWGLMGVWIGFTLALAIIAVLQGAYWLLVSKETKRLANQKFITQQLANYKLTDQSTPNTTTKKCMTSVSTPYIASTHELLSKV